MLFSPLSVFSTAVAALLVSSWTGASASFVGTHVVVARQDPSAAAAVTTCAYKWTCDATLGYSTGTSAGPARYSLRCIRPASNATGPSSSCWYSMHGGNSTTGVANPVDYTIASPYNSTVPCPLYTIRSSTEDSCSTVSARRRGVATSPGQFFL
ncbi:hypothetical protein BDY24DRAFT_434797, partial [Mrakia frigida]|uniref:uncharacterized protein n=1 Tax=Mrakia frigida TaxID=29902 RepID=UPI003FCBEF7D